jgi:hypothetical protein
MTFSYSFDDENIKIKHRSHAPTMLLGIIPARWRCPVASSEALGARLRTGALPWPSKWPALQVCLLIVVCMPVALAAAGAIQSKYLPNAGNQWLLE